MPKVTYRSHWSSPEAFHLLLALSRGPQNCSDLQSQITADSVGAVYIPRSSLYRWLATAQKRGLLTITSPAWIRPTTYSISHRGQRDLERLGRNYATLAHLAQQRLA